MFIEIIKAVLMGIVEGITEWLPVSSTGHMILLEQLVHFNASEEFLSMFGWSSSWERSWRWWYCSGKALAFGIRRAGSAQPAVFGWVKVIVATLPALLVSPLDDWMEARFYNHITVAAHADPVRHPVHLGGEPPAAPRSGRPMQIGLREALIIGIWQVLAIIPGTSRPALPSWAACCWAAPGAGGRVHLLWPFRSWRGPAAQGGQVCAVRRSHHRGRGGRAGGGLRGGLCGQPGDHPLLMDYQAPQLHRVWRLPHPAGSGGAGRGRRTGPGLAIRQKKCLQSAPSGCAFVAMGAETVLYLRYKVFAVNAWKATVREELYAAVHRLLYRLPLPGHQPD